MRSHTTALLEYLDTSRGVLTHAVDRVSADRRDQAPSAGRWSVAEVLEHLATVERGVGVLIRRAMTKAPAADPGLIVDRAAILARVAPLEDRSQQVDAPDRVRPTGAVTADAAWAALGDTRRALVETITATDDLDLHGISVPHGILGPLNLYEWMAFVGAHERRHAAQIIEVGAIRTATRLN